MWRESFSASGEFKTLASGSLVEESIQPSDVTHDTDDRIVKPVIGI